MKKVLLALVVAYSILMAGCGGEPMTEQEYLDYTRTELTAFMHLVQSEKLNYEDYRMVKTPVEKQKHQIEEIQQKLRSIQPPQKYVEEHMQVLIVVDCFVKRDEALLRYAKSGSGYDLAKANDYFSVGINNMNEAPTFFFTKK